MNLPWQIEPLSDWSICGMNHYNINGYKRLFVSMTKNGRCIRSEGPDDGVIWIRLAEQARSMDQ